MDLYAQLVAIAQVIAIDFILAGDNAIVVGMAASRVDPRMRTKVIVWGVGGAVLLRVLFALVATQLLAIVGLTLAGGILLLWVCWKMYRELRHQAAEAAMQPAIAGMPSGSGGDGIRQMTFGAALMQIIIADVSMSLDNVLAVAGAAKGDIWVLMIGLTVAIIFMAIASSYIAKLLSRYPWITWIGLFIILYVALEMIWSGSHQVACSFVSPSECQAGALATFRSLL